MELRGETEAETVEAASEMGGREKEARIGERCHVRFLFAFSGDTIAQGFVGVNPSGKACPAVSRVAQDTAVDILRRIRLRAVRYGGQARLRWYGRSALHGERG